MAKIAVEARWFRGSSLVVIGMLGVAVGALLGSPAGAAFGLALIVAPLAVRALLLHTIRRAAVWHVAPRSASEGERVAVTVVIENRSRAPLWFARVTEVFGPESLAPRKTEFATRIDPGRKAERSYVAVCRRARGIYVHGPIVLEVGDPFDWFTVSRVLDVIDEFKVYPRLQNTRLPERLFASLSQPNVARHALRLSEPDEFFAVRDFVPGDSMKRIHWPLTARRDFPVVREFLPSVQQEIVFFLDVSRQLRFSGARLTNFESSVRFAASLAARAVRSGFAFQLRCGSQGTFDVPAAGGRGHFRRIVDTLVRVRTRTEDPFPAALGRRLHRLPRGATAVVVLHPYLLGDPAFAEAVGRMARRGLRVACVVYHVRSDLVGPRRLRKHSAFLTGLADLGVELWTDLGTPLARGRVPVTSS
jgi:uncharacterized protein (DUF58 family)